MISKLIQNVSVKAVRYAAVATWAVGSFMTVAAGSAAADPTLHVVEAAGVRFKPMFIYVEPGDQVSFERMPTHNVETLDGMHPQEQEKLKTELGENFVTTFEHEGIVVYKCTPHWGNRMGGIIVVGQPENPGAILDAYMALTEEKKEHLPARGLIKKLRKDMEQKGMM